MLDREEFKEEQERCPHCRGESSCAYHWAVWHLHVAIDMENQANREESTIRWIGHVRRDWERQFES